MATLYVENVPDNLYKALRARAHEHHRSIAAEVLLLLEQNIPTEEELRSRRAFYVKVQRMQKRKQPPARPYPSAEEMVREDRSR
ncbi:MAG: FitA-like ribbon-helix-helix domain-containing protein [Candidatus Saccharimonadales bacterium]